MQQHVARDGVTHLARYFARGDNTPNDLQSAMDNAQVSHVCTGVHLLCAINGHVAYADYKMKLLLAKLIMT